MTQDKTFNLFLIDGTSQGRISCKAENWAGIAFKIPKTQIEDCDDLNELNHAGIYFLFNESEVYIGAGKFQNVGDFWSDAFIFTNPKNPFDLNSLKFLKNNFSLKIAAANRYKVKNEDENFFENISAEKASRLEIFEDYVQTILYFFGYKIFEPPKEIQNQIEPPPMSKIQPPKTDSNPIFYLDRNLKNANMRVKATCKRISEDIYIVLAGSQISPITAKYISENIKKERKKAKISSENILLKEVTFKSPSGAAEFVTGLSANGWQTWKTKDGMTIAEFLSSETAKE